MNPHRLSLRATGHLPVGCGYLNLEYHLGDTGVYLDLCQAKEYRTACCDKGLEGGSRWAWAKRGPPVHGGPKATSASRSPDRSPGGDGRAVRGARERAKHRRRIMRAVRDLLATDDANDLKVADIARTAGCSAATVHNHFPNALPDILGAIAAEIMGAATHRYEIGAPKWSGLDKARGYVQSVADEFYKVGNLTARVVSVSVDQARKGQWLEDTALEALIGCFDAATEAEELPGTSADLARLTHLLFHGALYSWSLGSLNDDEFLYWAGQSVDLAVNARRCLR